MDMTTATTMTRATMAGGPLASADLRELDAYWRAANYLSVGQIYLLENPLLREPLTLAHIKPRLLGHWGTTPGLNFIYAHLNRVIRRHDLDMIFVAGPGHGGPAVVANTYLEGTYSELYPEVSRDAEGMKTTLQAVFLSGRHPESCGAGDARLHRRGRELGYSLAHAFGAAFDNPDLIVACVIGDGEAETGPLATAWHSNKFLNPATDGAVLPILHLNGYKIASPTLLARIGDEELTSLFRGYGYRPYLVDGIEPDPTHQAMAETLERVIAEIRAIQVDARANGHAERPQWPMIILRTPKGWTGPEAVDGKKTEGSWRSHQVPLAEWRRTRSTLGSSSSGCGATGPRSCSTKRGRWSPSWRHWRRSGTADGCQPTRQRRRAAPRPRHAGLPRPRRRCAKAGMVISEATRILGGFLRDVMRRNGRDFRVFGPDETASNRLGALFDVTDRTWMAERTPDDEQLSPDGRVMEMLSEHTCQGWLEGYLLTGRHGLFSCYEAFIHIVDSMFNQHAKWLKVTREISWRRSIASLNYLLTSHVWRQDHNGFSHQDPGFIDHVVNKKADVIRVYLPPDANTLLSVADHCLRSRHYVNVIVAGKQPALQYLDMECGHQALHGGHRDLGVGEQRSRRRAGCGHGLRGRCADARDARRGQPAARVRPGAQGARDQRGRSHAAPAGRESIPTGCRIATSTHSSRPTSRSSSPITATRG